MAKATKEEMKKEALRYMEMLNISEEIRHAFDRDGTICASYGADGSVRAADDEEKKLAADVEKEYGGVIYHIILNKFLGEDMTTMLHVSQYKDEWEHYLTEAGDNDFLTCAYVKSAFEQGFGSVVLTSASGAGVVRKG